MALPQPVDTRLIDGQAGFTQQHVGEQAARHADAAMDAPDGKLDAFLAERVVPRQDMLVDAVHQRAVEIEQVGNGISCHVCRP